jgi:succinoglycan biosynthesis transport protein ExoP
MRDPSFPPAPRPVPGRLTVALPPRARIFLAVFLPTLALALAYALLRPATYRAEATLEVDLANGFDDPLGGAAYQAYLSHVQGLTRRSVLAATVDRLGGKLSLDDSGDPVARLSRVFHAEPVEGTDLIRVVAEGRRPERLPLLVDTLVQVYLEQHRREQASDEAEETAALRSRANELEQRMAALHERLASFKAQHDIVSLEREENEVLTRLGDLTRSLARAEDESRAARAAEETAIATLRSEEPPLLPRDRRALDALESKAAAIREELREMGKVWTPQYLSVDPKVKRMRRELERLEEQHARRLEQARANALEAARQRVAEAEGKVRRIRAELAAQKADAQRFTGRLQELRTLQEELERLGGLFQETREALAQAELSDPGRLARLRVLEPALVGDRPVSPNYARDAGLGTLGAFVLALLGVWLVDYLRAPARAREGFQPGPLARPLETELQDRWHPAPLPAHDRSRAPLPEARHPRLASTPRRLSNAELAALWSAANEEARLAMGALLSGLSVDELVAARRDALDLDAGVLRLADRALSLPPALLDLLGRSPGFGPAAPLLGDAGTGPVDPAHVAGLLACAAIDAGLASPHEVNPQVLRHTYLLYLVEQGARLGDLHRQVGRLPPALLAAYGAASPPGPGLPLDRIDPHLPLLRQPPEDWQRLE